MWLIHWALVALHNTEILKKEQDVKILPSQLLLNIYKPYVQIKINYGLSIWGCTTEANLDRIQRIQNYIARIMCNNFDFINLHGIEMVQTLRLQTIRERRDYFLCILMLKCIHGLAAHCLGNDVTMYVDINGYDTRSAENMDLYLWRCSREIYKRRFSVQMQFTLESATVMLEWIYIDN